MLQGLVLNIHLFAPKIKKLFGNRAGQLRHLGSLRLLTLSSLAKMFQRACRQKQPEQRLFLLSAPVPLSKEGEWCQMRERGFKAMSFSGLLCFFVILGLAPRIHKETGRVLIVRWIAGSKSGNDRYDRWRTFYTVS